MSVVPILSSIAHSITSEYIKEVSIVNDNTTKPNIGMSTYKLQAKQNRGVPPNGFSLERKVKYPIANYVSCERCSLERKTLVNHTESLKIPTQEEEALRDP